MTQELKDKVRRLKKVIRAFSKVKERLPSTYPQASLVVHMTEEELKRYWYDCEGGEDEEFEEGDLSMPAYEPFGFCNATTNTIHVHAGLGKETVREICRIILHEMGHLFAYMRYGEKDRRWKKPSVAEPYADRFAARWTRKLANEGWFA